MLDYRAKYKELKAKLIESTDVAYRLGFEAGLKQATQDQMQMQVQQAQQQAMQMQVAMGGAPQGGSPEEQAAMGGAPQGEAPMGMEDQGGMGFQQPMAGEGEEPELAPGEVSELDQYINELEDLVAKGEKPSVIEMRKRVTKLAELRKSQKAKMKANKPKVVSAQKKLVDNILSKWEKESKMTSENLEDIVREHGIKLD